MFRLFFFVNLLVVFSSGIYIELTMADVPNVVVIVSGLVGLVLSPAIFILDLEV
jgi:hypothetical protein